VPVTRGDIKEGLLIATAVFIVVLVLALLFVYVSLRFQQLGSIADDPSSKPGGQRPVRMLVALTSPSRGPVRWPG
jgi:hypothetical protein